MFRSSENRIHLTKWEGEVMRSGVGVWPRVMKREGLCNGVAQEREKQRSIWRRERKWREKKRGPSNDNKTRTHINSIQI